MKNMRREPLNNNNLKKTGLFSTLSSAFIALFALSLLFGMTPPVYAEKSKDSYEMGVFPFLSAREIEKIFAPMAAAFSEVLGKPVIFKTASSYLNFMERLGNQQYDIAFVQPFDYINAADKNGYRPLASRDEMLTAIVVTKDPTRLSIKDLRGKVISLPPKVAAVSILVKRYLIEHGYKPGVDVKLQHFGSHVSCMQQVLIGTADGCGTAFASSRFFNKKMKANLQVAFETPGIPHTLFIAHPNVPQHEKDKLSETIFNWASTEKGKEILSRGRMKPFKKILDEDYDIVREIAKTVNR